MTDEAKQEQKLLTIEEMLHIAHRIASEPANTEPEEQ